MTFKIEKDVPTPAHGTNGGYAKYPWSEMEVGDSFFVEGAGISSLPIAYASKKHGFKFTRRTEDTGVRVWRIA